MIGALVSFVGVGCVLLYPLAPADTIPGSYPLNHSDGIESSHPLVVYLSVVGGPMLLTWGAFTLRHRTLTPLTPRRTLLAPLLGLLGIVAGVGRFTYEWVRMTPFEVTHDIDSTSEIVDPSVLEIVQREFTGVQLVALAAILAMAVGAVAARRGWRGAIVSALVPHPHSS